jgi:hypothetical protein
LSFPFDAAGKVSSSHVGTLALAKPVIHQAVAEPDALL